VGRKADIGKIAMSVSEGAKQRFTVRPEFATPGCGGWIDASSCVREQARCDL